MRRFLALSILLVPALASARDYEFSYGLRMQWYQSSSMDFVSTEDAHAMPHVGVAVGMGSPIPFADRVYAEGRYSVTNLTATSFGDIESRLQLNEATFGVRADKLVLRRINLFAGAALGFVHGGLEMDGGGSTISDGDWAPVTSAELGAELVVVKANEDWADPDFALGLRFELGYVESGALDYAANPDYPDDGLSRIETSAAQLGTVDASGATFRFALTGRW